MGGEPAGGGARLVKRKYSIEKQRTRPPFFKFSLAKEMLAIFEIMFGGRICGCYILTISIEKQRKRPPFFVFIMLGGRMGGPGNVWVPMWVPLLVFC